MRKYFGVLLMGLGGGLFLIFLAAAIATAAKKHPELKGATIVDLIAFYFGIVLVPFITFFISRFLVRVGKRMYIQINSLLSC